MYYVTHHEHTKDVDIWRDVNSGVLVHYMYTVHGGDPINIIEAIVFDNISLCQKFGVITMKENILPYVISENEDYDIIMGIASIEAL